MMRRGRRPRTRAYAAITSRYVVKPRRSHRWRDCSRYASRSTSATGWTEVLRLQSRQGRPNKRRSDARRCRRPLVSQRISALVDELRDRLGAGVFATPARRGTTLVMVRSLIRALPDRRAGWGRWQSECGALDRHSGQGIGNGLVTGSRGEGKPPSLAVLWVLIDGTGTHTTGRGTSAFAMPTGQWSHRIAKMAVSSSEIRSPRRSSTMLARRSSAQEAPTDAALRSRSMPTSRPSRLRSTRPSV